MIYKDWLLGNGKAVASDLCDGFGEYQDYLGQESFASESEGV